MILKTQPNASKDSEHLAQSVCRSKLGLFWGVVLLNSLSSRGLAAESLPGTEPLDWTDDLSVRIIEEAHHWLDRKLDESITTRERLWNRDFSSNEAYEKSVEPNREHFRECIGVFDLRLPIVMERYGDDFNPALVAEAVTTTESPRARGWNMNMPGFAASTTRSASVTARQSSSSTGATKSTASARSNFWKSTSTGLHRPSTKENRSPARLNEQGTILKLE